jgi:hypothetical protein
MTTPQPDGAALTPERLGVGARFSLFPMTDDFVAVILGALDGVHRDELEIRTGDVSTYLSGSEQRITEFLTATLAAAARTTSTGHVAASVLLSRGCPGEEASELSAGTLPPAPPVPAAPPVQVAPTGMDAVAHWSVYPVACADAMAAVSAAINVARDAGTYAGSERHVTRLAGDLAEVVATVTNGWLAAATASAQVTTHATISIGSPTASGAVL